jgi:hypothetical protein
MIAVLARPDPFAALRGLAPPATSSEVDSYRGSGLLAASSSLLSRRNPDHASVTGAAPEWVPE